MKINNITAAWAVDREFLNIYLGALGASGCVLGPLGATWGALGLPCGAFWDPRDLFFPRRPYVLRV